MAEAPRFRRLNWKAFLLCLLAAVVFWLFSALNKESTTDIRFPVTILFDESRYIPTGPLPDHILINVTGTGWDLLATEIGWRHDPLPLALDKPDRSGYLLTQTLLKDFSISLGVSRLNFIHGDSLKFQFDRIATRKIKLALNTSSLSFREGYGIAGVVNLKPDSAEVTGPAKMVRELGNTIELSIGDRKLSRAFEDQIEIFHEKSLLAAKPKNVNLKVPVGRVRTFSFSVPVKLEAPDNKWKITQTSADLSIRIPEENISALDTSLVWIQLQLRKPAANRFYMHGVVKGLPQEAILLQSDSIEVYRSPK